MEDIEQQKPRLSFWRWAILLAALFFLTFHSDFIYKNWYWAQWGFLFEEGIYLRWINDLLRGRILYRDIYFYCGPFMIWPQYWLMKLFGASVVVHRYYIYFCYFIGYLIVFKALRSTIRNKLFILIGMTLILFFYYPMFPGVHQSLVRYSVSLLPLYFLYRSFFQRQSFYLFISGIFLGFALLFSQELGLSSLVVSAAMMAVFTYREGIRARNILRQLFLLAAGISVFVLPVLAYFFVNHALADFFGTMTYSPETYAMGAFAIKVPILLDIFKSNPEYQRIEIALAYLPILFYICSIFFFLVLFLRKSFSNKHIFFFGIAALGSMMFQRAFGIYSLMTIKNVIYPVIILTMAYLDMAWQRTRRLQGERKTHWQRAEIALYAGIFLLIGSGFINYGLPGRGFAPSIDPYTYRSSLGTRYDGFVPVGLPRANNIWMPLEWASTMKRSVEYITTNTRPDEPIYVFPYWPAFYFLTDRLSPVKYPAIYTMISEHRRYVAQELEKRKVNYIICVKREQPFLGLSPEQRFPEIADYLHKNYELEKEFGQILILKRKNSVHSKAVINSGGM